EGDGAQLQQQVIAVGRVHPLDHRRPVLRHVAEPHQAARQQLGDELAAVALVAPVGEDRFLLAGHLAQHHVAVGVALVIGVANGEVELGLPAAGCRFLAHGIVSCYSRCKPSCSSTMVCFNRLVEPASRSVNLEDFTQAFWNEKVRTTWPLCSFWIIPFLRTLEPPFWVAASLKVAANQSAKRLSSGLPST